MNLLKAAFHFLLVLFFINAHAQKENVKADPKEETWLWEISGNGLAQPSYLFGTIHILCPEDFELSDNLENKLRKSKQLVLEVVDAENPANLLVLMQGMTMKGKKLKDLYTTEEYAEIKKFFKDSAGISIETFSAFKPMFIVASLYPIMMGCTEIKSFETELTTLARQQGKEVKEVESLEQQLHFFDTIPYHIQAAELLRTVREWNREKAVFAELVNLYKNQSYSQSVAFIHANMGDMTEYKDVLLDNRNKAWIPKIKAAAAEKSTFFAFGAGHLAGDNGLINLLRKEGYTVEPLKN